MKLRLLTLLLFITLINFKTWAQFSVGTKIGINNSYLINEGSLDLENGKRNYGFQGGIFTRGEILFLFVQPELLYMAGRGDLEFENDLGDIELINYEFKRIDFPIFAGFRLWKSLRIGVGPVFSVLLEDSLIGKTNNSLGFSNSNVGYLAGVGFDIWNLVFDLRYEGGISGLTENVFGVEADDRIRQLTFSVGLKLYSSKK